MQEQDAVSLSRELTFPEEVVHDPRLSQGPTEHKTSMPSLSGSVNGTSWLHQ